MVKPDRSRREASRQTSRGKQLRANNHTIDGRSGVEMADRSHRRAPERDPRMFSLVRGIFVPRALPRVPLAIAVGLTLLPEGLLEMEGAILHALEGFPAVNLRAFSPSCRGLGSRENLRHRIYQLSIYKPRFIPRLDQRCALPVHQLCVAPTAVGRHGQSSSHHLQHYVRFPLGERHLQRAAVRHRQPLAEPFRDAQKLGVILQQTFTRAKVSAGKVDLKST
jgi:hypothetical protein